jgi:DNA mismatch repair protein MSH6
MAIAGAVLHELATHTLALSCFATHYSTLTGDYSYHPNIRNMHMKTVVDDEKREVRIVSLHIPTNALGLTVTQP